MKKTTLMLPALISLILLGGCRETDAALNYERVQVHPVGGRQGICTEEGYYWVSGSAALEKYDSSWNAAESPLTLIPEQCI